MGCFMDWRFVVSVVLIIASVVGLIYAVKTKNPGGWIATLLAGIYGAVVCHSIKMVVDRRLPDVLIYISSGFSGA